MYIVINTNDINLILGLCLTISLLWLVIVAINWKLTKLLFKCLEKGKEK